MEKNSVKNHENQCIIYKPILRAMITYVGKSLENVIAIEEVVLGPNIIGLIKAHG